jgi:Prokaryotic RING finger family 1
MSSLWRQTSGGAWESVALSAEGLRPVRLSPDVTLVGFGRGADGGVALMTRPGAAARVNGLPILGGLRLLDHQDEVLIGRERFYYSAESTPVVVPFRHEGEGRRPSCPICRGPLGDGDDAVQCPGCGRWYHQLAARPCFTYAPQCRFCRHPTALTGAAVWCPEQEDSRE